LNFTEEILNFKILFFQKMSRIINLLNMEMKMINF